MSLYTALLHYRRLPEDSSEKSMISRIGANARIAASLIRRFSVDG